MSAAGRSPSELALEELRAERGKLQAEEHAVSYARRLAQGRLDLVRAEIRSRAAGGHLDVDHDLSAALSQHVLASAPAPTSPGEGADATATIGGSARPPRQTSVPDDHPLLHDLDERCERLGLHNLAELDTDEISELESELDAFEHACSAERHLLFQRIDALTSELVHRYRDGAATVDTLLDGPDDG